MFWIMNNEQVKTKSNDAKQKEFEENCNDTDYMYYRLKNFVWMIVKTGFSDDEQRCEEIMQDTFTKFFKANKKFDHFGGAVCYIKKIAQNTLIDYQRKYFKERDRYDLTDNVEVLAAEPDYYVNESEETVLINELAIKLQVEINKLKPEIREVIEMIRLNGFTPKEVSRILKVNLNTVYSRKRLAEKVLFNHLSVLLEKGEI